MRRKLPLRIRYAIAGFIVGLLFPFLAYLMLVRLTDSSFGFSQIIAFHQAEPLLYIIDLIPFSVAFSSYRAGLRIEQSRAASGSLSQNILQQSDETLRQFAYFESLVKQSEDAVVQIDNDQVVISFNPAFERLFGYSGHELVGRKLDELLVSEDELSEAQDMTSKVTQGAVIRRRAQRRRKDGTFIDVEVMAIPAYVGGRPMGALGIYSDISPLVKAEELIRENEARFRSLFEDSPIALWEEDFSRVKETLDTLRLNGVRDLKAYFKENEAALLEIAQMVRVLDVNQAALDLFGAKLKDRFLRGITWGMTPETLESFRGELASLYSGKRLYRDETELKKLNGEAFHAAVSVTLPSAFEHTWDRVYVSMLDISDRIRNEDRLRHISFHDALTGVANRLYFQEEMARLESSRRFPVTLLVCDVDNLKTINDTQGHEAGDAAIRSVAHVLQRVFRNEDMIARIGGDEFAAILADTSNIMEDVSIRRMERVLDLFNKEKVDDDYYRPIELSYGIYTVSQGQSLADGLKLADEKMYQMKAERKRKNKQER
jgi:diguanylate cyclase (GGDEF)-like protein/PAS domain S-box-containing protein